MKLILDDKAGAYGPTFLFLTEGELEDDNFRILAETDFQDLGTENFEALEFFIEEANRDLGL
jgi:hypothetical protein